MFSDVGPLLVFAALSLVPALLVYRARRDVVDPRVIFPVLYFLLTSGPVLWHLTGGAYYAGIEAARVPDVLLSCGSAIFAFTLGATAILWRPLRPAGVGGLQHDPGVMRVARVVLVVAALGLLVAYAFISLRMKQSSGAVLKAAVISSAGPELARAYYFLSAGLFVATTALVALDSYISRGRRNPVVLAVLGMYLIVQTWNDEREIALVLGAWMLLNARYWSRRFIIALVLGVSLFVGTIAVVRAGRDDEARARLMEDQEVSDIAESLLTKSSSNLFVFSKIITWVPEEQPYRWGSTYGDSLLSFFPGASEESKRSLSDWFKSVYAPGSGSGYGFAMDAEAYLNFGWIGPPLVFFLWGALLGWLYARARRPGAGWFNAFLWVLTTSYSIFAVRADSRMLFKMLGYGLIGGGLVLVTSTLLAGSARRALARRQQMTKPTTVAPP